MATRDDGCWRSEVTDLLLDAEHREELQRVRVGVWAFQHVAASEATGQIAAVLNAVASAAASEWVWRLVDLEAASSDELRSLAIAATVLRGETVWRQVDGVCTATAENSSPWSSEIRDVWAAVLDTRFDKVDARFDKIDAKIDAKVDGLSVQLGEINGRVSRIEGHLGIGIPPAVPDPAAPGPGA